MKTIITLILVSLFTLPAFAQDEETLIGGKITSSGFGGPVLKLTGVNGETGLLMGGRGGWIINHAFSIGGAGYGLVTNVNAKTPSIYGERYLNFGYGGLDLEYTPASNDLIHASFIMLIGAGGIGYRDADFNVRHKSTDTFFVLEPEANMTLNVTHYFRISAGFSYRYISGVETAASASKDLSGPSGTLTFRFGEF